MSTSKIYNAIHQTNMQLDIDNELEFDLMTDELSDRLSENIADQLIKNEIFKGCAHKSVELALTAMRDDPNLDHWPAWNKYPKEVPKKLNEAGKEVLARFAKILHVIYDETSWKSLEHSLLKLEDCLNYYSLNVDRLLAYVQAEFLHSTQEANFEPTQLNKR